MKMPEFTVAVLLGSVALPMQAQTVPSRHALCWWNPTMSRCRNILVTEAGLTRTMASSSATVVYHNDFTGQDLEPSRARFEIEPAASVEFALLHAIDDRTAVGPAVQWATGEARRTIGLRARRALTHGLVAEGEVGVVMGYPGENDIGYTTSRMHGLALSARFGHPRIAGIGVTYHDMGWPPLSNGERYVVKPGRARSVSINATAGPLLSSVSGVVIGVLIGAFIAGGGFQD